MKLINTSYKLLLMMLFTCQSAIASTITPIATDKIAKLQTLITNAKNQELDVTREQMTVRMAELFMAWADWDDKNQVINVKFYQKHPTYKNNATVLAANLGEFERQSVNTMLDNAINELTAVINGHINRQPVPTVNFNEVDIREGEFRLPNNQSVFLSTYTWKPSDELTNPYFGNLHSAYISPSFIVDEQGNTEQKRIDKLNNDNDQRIGQVFINHNALPQWIIEQYPTIIDNERIFSKYLIDNPGAKVLFSSLFKTFIPLLKNKRSTALGYMMFNEPSFFTQAGKWNSGSVDDAAIAKFRIWLATQHENIEHLNTLWQSSFNSFDEVSINLPMEGDLKGSAIWYDWMRFNQVRVTEWFSFLDSEIKKYDNDAKTHIKLMPWLWNESARDHGLDFESLLEITDIIGFDANSEYLNHKSTTPWYQENYSFDWQSPAISFDFFSSIQPNQVMWDSENHFFNKGKFQLKDVAPDYVRAVYWLAATHGLDGVSTWMWARNTDGSIIENRGYNSEYITGVTHQPLGFHELTRTVMDINAYHQEVVDLQNQEKAIRLFYSETSAIVQNDYMDSIRDAHRSIFFEGLALGFVTQKIIEKQHNDWKFIVVNDSVQITSAELSALKNYVDNGGTLLLDQHSLKKDQYGKPHAPNLLPSGERVIYYNTLAQLRTKTIELANNNKLLPAIKLTELGNEHNKKIAWRVVNNTSDDFTLSLINTGKEAVTIELAAVVSDQELVLTNLMTGQTLDNNMNLAIRETLLLKATLRDLQSSEADNTLTDNTSTITENKSSKGGASGFLILLCLLIGVRKSSFISSKETMYNNRH